MRYHRLKDLGRWYSGGTPPRGDDELWNGDVPWLSAKDIDSTVLREPTTFITRIAARKFSRLVPSGALLVIVRGMALVHGLPVVQVQEEVAFNQDLRALVCVPDLVPRFVYYSLIGHRWLFDAHIDRAAHGTARVVDSLYRERIPIPSRDDQVRVTAMLDAESKGIDDTVHAHNALLERINEYEDARLDEVVWGSGYPTAQLRYLCPLLTSGPRGWGDLASDTGSTAFIGIGALDRTQFGLRTEGLRYVTPPGGSESSRARTRTGDLLLSITADLGTVGVVGPEHRDAVVSQHVALIRPDLDRVDPLWLALVLKSPRTRSAVRSSGYGGTKQGLGLRQVGAVEVPLPPLDEQRSLAAGLQASRDRNSRLVASVVAMRKGLHEYRASLITDVVSGAVDLSDSRRTKDRNSGFAGGVDDLTRAVA